MYTLCLYRCSSKQTHKQTLHKKTRITVVAVTTIMPTSWHRHTLCVIAHLCGESTVSCWFPAQRSNNTFYGFQVVSMSKYLKRSTDRWNETHDITLTITSNPLPNVRVPIALQFHGARTSATFRSVGPYRAGTSRQCPTSGLTQNRSDQEEQSSS